jgi:cytochrome oxidase Cu insertion factor (SCO1/SenC/PrrC family)
LWTALGVADLVQSIAGSGLNLFDPDSFRNENLMNIHDKAPDFTLQDENGKEISLQDLRGKTVVLYFYPRADTPG